MGSRLVFHAFTAEGLGSFSGWGTKTDRQTHIHPGWGTKTDRQDTHTLTCGVLEDGLGVVGGTKTDRQDTRARARAHTHTRTCNVLEDG